MLDAFVDLELRMGLQILPHRSLRVVARAPWPVGEHVGRHVFDYRVEDNTVAAHLVERRIGLQLGKHMLVCVVAVQANEHALVS
jgi:hypothetical protein